MRTVLCVAASLFVVVPAFGDTDITEGISTNTTWGIAGSPYIVHGDISVGGHSTLTIDPGVTVEFDTGAKLTIQAESFIFAEGTEEDRILFTSHAETPAPGDWQSVYLFYAGVPMDPPVLSYCIFEYGQYNLYCDRCHPIITSCISRHASSAGIFCEVASPTITDCEIVGNTTGIRVSGPYAYPTIHYSNLYDNYENMYLSGYNAEPVAEIHAENNWWGVDTYEEIGDTITITSGATQYVTVLYDPWLHESPVVDMTWGGIKALFTD
jgi:hypothetical protein